MTAAAFPAFAQKSPVQRYSGTAILLHWAIAILIGANMAMGYFCANSELPIGDVIMNLHKVTGILILGLSLFRLAWRLTNRPPALTPMPTWRMRVAELVQNSLYGLMIGLPFTGWIVTSSFPKRHPISLGIVDLPFLPVGASLPRAMVAHDMHSLLAIMMAALVAGHVAAAMHHQFVLRDRLIARMFWQRQPKDK